MKLVYYQFCLLAILLLNLSKLLALFTQQILHHLYPHIAMTNILQVSTQVLNYNLNENMKIITLKNLTKYSQNPQPIMFKVKTNKVDLVDAKPSCGYISSNKNSNSIKVRIRVSKKQPFNAKLQILYVLFGQITQKIVSQNRQHLNLAQYNEFYERIKKNGNAKVKNHIIQISKTSQGLNQNNQDEEELQSYIKANKSSNSNDIAYPRLSQIKDETNAQQHQKQMHKNQKNQKLNNKSMQANNMSKPQQKIISISQGKFIKFLAISFLVGLILGYFLQFNNNSQLNTQGVNSQQEAPQLVQNDSSEVWKTQKQSLKGNKNQKQKPRFVSADENSQRLEEPGRIIINGDFQIPSSIHKQQLQSDQQIGQLQAQQNENL